MAGVLSELGAECINEISCLTNCCSKGECNYSEYCFGRCSNNKQCESECCISNFCMPLSECKTSTFVIVLIFLIILVVIFLSDFYYHYIVRQNKENASKIVNYSKGEMELKIGTGYTKMN